MRLRALFGLPSEPPAARSTRQPDLRLRFTVQMAVLTLLNSRNPVADAAAQGSTLVTLPWPARSRRRSRQRGMIRCGRRVSPCCADERRQALQPSLPSLPRTMTIGSIKAVLALFPRVNRRLVMRRARPETHAAHHSQRASSRGCPAHSADGLPRAQPSTSERHGRLADVGNRTTKVFSSAQSALIRPGLETEN